MTDFLVYQILTDKALVNKFDYEMVFYKRHKKFLKKPEFKTHMHVENNTEIVIVM